MPENLLKECWTRLGSHELRLLLAKYAGGPGQYDGKLDNPQRFYLPLAREHCKIVLTYKGSEIDKIEPGEAFDAEEWQTISAGIDNDLLGGAKKVGRDYSFSSFRVLGSWRGTLSGIQILPPPEDAGISLPSFSPSANSPCPRGGRS